MFISNRHADSLFWVRHVPDSKVGPMLAPWTLLSGVSYYATYMSLFESSREVGNILVSRHWCLRLFTTITFFDIHHHLFHYPRRMPPTTSPRTGDCTRLWIKFIWSLSYLILCELTGCRNLRNKCFHIRSPSCVRPPIVGARNHDTHHQTCAKKMALSSITSKCHRYSTV